ncbi:MAG: hypothetical protein K0R54_604 [Clostridiaceae bacterium]|jgi:hypothetical protein|nr:hypothetical protein [Clostridiaceae bacterium]
MDKIKLHEQNYIMRLSVQELTVLYDRGLLSVNLFVGDSDVQRNFVWTPKKSARLIDSLLNQKNGFIIPALIGIDKQGIIYIADGQQRLLTLINFVQNNIKFPKETKIENKDVSNLTFNKLPEEMQKRILKETVNISVVEYISDEQVKEIFLRLNSGLNLQTIEAIRPYLAPKLKDLKIITGSKFFNEVIKFGKQRSLHFADLDLALGFLMEHLYPNSDQNKRTREIFAMNTIKSITFNNELKESVLGRLNYLYKVFDKDDIGKENFAIAKSKILKNANFIILYKMAGYLVEEDVNAEKAFNFFNWYFVDNDFNYKVVAGTTSTSNKSSIEVRYEHILKEFKKFNKRKNSNKVKNVIKNVLATS